MARRYPSQGARLLVFLMNRGGSATVNEIRRHTNDGRLLDRARPELGDLITEEKSRKATAKRRKRACRRVSLSLRGLAAAQALQPGWEARRLATHILREWFRELVQEREPWAYALARAEDKAREYDAIRKDWERFQFWRARRDRLNARRHLKESRREAAAGRLPTQDAVQVPQFRTPSQIRRPAVFEGSTIVDEQERLAMAEQHKVDTETAWRTACPLCASDARLGMPYSHPSIQDCQRTLLLLDQPTPELPEPPKPEPAPMPIPRMPSYFQPVAPMTATPIIPPRIDPLIEKIRAAGYTVKDGKALYAGERWISSEEWVRLNPHVKL
jgi:hypothetical protein